MMLASRGVGNAGEVEIDKVKMRKKNREIEVDEIEIQKKSKSYIFFTKVLKIEPKRSPNRHFEL